MRVLIGCEFSGTVRDAFIKRGHDAISCDLLPTEKPGPHHQGDIMELLNSKPDGYYDLIIIHPECTKLTVSGNHVYGVGKPRHQERLDSVRWTYDLWELCKRKSKSVCLENPVGVLNSYTDMPKPQYIQPYDFGSDASKKTGLWLHNLPKLKVDKSKYVQPRIVNGKKRWSNQTDSGQNKLPPSKDRWKLRSETYSGIAVAFAEQWNKRNSNG